MRIRWSPLAIERVSAIAAWIAGDRPDAADRFVDGLFSAVDRVARFPRSGPEVPEFQRPERRQIICGHYRIIYRIRKSTVEILTVRHSLQVLDQRDLDDETTGAGPDA